MDNHTESRDVHGKRGGYRRMAVAVCTAILVVTLAGCGSGGAAASSAQSQSAATSSGTSSTASSSETAASPSYDSRLSPALSDEEKAFTEVIDLGETVSTDEYDLQLSDWYWDKAGSGNDWEYAPGYHTYGDQDMNILVVHGTYTNKRNDPVTLSSSSGGTYLLNGDKSYTATVTHPDLEISPLETEEIFVYAEVPDAMKGQFDTGELFIGMNRAGKSIVSSGNIDIMYQLDFE